MTAELNQAMAEYAIALAANGSKAGRLELDRNEAANAHQEAKDAWEKHVVSDEEKQRNCMVEQYNNDMAARERLNEYLSAC